jgi:uncharacterized damage-inducible protein DinB
VAATTKTPSPTSCCISKETCASGSSTASTTSPTSASATTNSLAHTLSAADALAHFNRTLDESARIIAAVDPDRLLIVIDPQPDGTWRHATILEAIFKVVGHVEMHTGQIIVLTKQLTAADLDLSMPRKR